MEDILRILDFVNVKSKKTLPDLWKVVKDQEKVNKCNLLRATPLSWALITPS